jgi:HSP20 family protein
MRFDPFRELDRFAEQTLSAGTRAIRTMPMEALRRGDESKVYIDLPGVVPDDIDLIVERNVVSVRARRAPAHQGGDDVIIDERPYGEFNRQLFLGVNIDPDHLTADTRDGVLELTIPVSEASKPRRVALGSGNTTGDGTGSKPRAVRRAAGRPPADSEGIMTAEQPRQAASATAAGTRGRTSGRPWSPGSPASPNRWARRTVAAYDNYEQAERAVDRLSDLNFPVERVTIIGQGASRATECGSCLSVPVPERCRQVVMHNARSAESMLRWMSNRSPLGGLVSTWSTAPPLVTK